MITRFVSRYGSYTFPTSPGDQEFRTNFAELVTRTERLPGSDGGFDNLGDERGLSPVGDVSLTFYLVSTTREAMQTLRDAARQVADWGIGRLYDTPLDGALDERFVWARVNSIQMPEQRHMHTDLHQRAQMNFQCSDPFWLGAGNQTLWGGGELWGGGALWGGTPITVSGTSTALTWTNSGNAYTQPKIALKPTAGNVVSDPIVRRIVDGAVVDEVRYIGTLTAADHLVINCRKMSVRLNGVALYTDQFSFKSASWLKLLPGANAIQIKFGSASDEADVMAQWYDRWV